jgi:hypothetical protein
MHYARGYLDSGARQIDLASVHPRLRLVLLICTMTNHVSTFDSVRISGGGVLQLLSEINDMWCAHLYFAMPGARTRKSAVTATWSVLWGTLIDDTVADWTQLTE